MPASDLKQKILAAAAIAFAATGCAEAEEAPIQAAPASEELPAAEPAPPPEPEATPEPQAAEPQAAERTLDGEESPAPEVEAEAPPAAERRRRSPRRATPSPTGGQAADSLEAMCGASCGVSCSGVEDDEE